MINTLSTFFLGCTKTPSRRTFSAGVAGAFSALAFPPLSLFPVIFLTFPFLIILVRRSTNLFEAFRLGWFFFFAMHVLSLYWIADALFVDIKTYGWVLPFALAGLPAVIALFYGPAVVAARAFGVNGLSGTLFFALCVFVAEYARGHLFTGFPWNIVAYSWDAVPSILQTTSVVGIYGLDLLTLLLASLPAAIDGFSRRNYTIVIIGAAVLLVMSLAGEYRFREDTGAIVADVRIRLVQPNIDQADKWRGGELETNFQNLLNLTASPALKPLSHIVWPETASTFYLEEDLPHRQKIAEYLPPDSLLLTGVVRRQTDEIGNLHFFNSMVVLNRSADIVAHYDKFHLVPFGEYIPFRKFLPWRTLTALGVDFSTGEGLKTLRVPGLPTLSPLICYEAVFPGAVARRDDPPQMLLNLTNDGWYGHTSGPYQHFASVRVRAIEEGVPVIRSANTGISGVIDPYGQVTAKLGLGKRGFIDVDLPKALPPTLYVRYGDTGLWVIYLTVLFYVIWRRRGVA